MQYDETSFAKDPKKPTMVAVEKGKKLGNEYGLAEV